MNKAKSISTVIFVILMVFTKVHAADFTKAYPGILKIQNNRVYFKNGTILPFSDDKSKTFAQKIENPSIKDMISQKYPLLQRIKTPVCNFDPGRFRNINFFKTLYGNSKKQIKKNLIKVIWLPKKEHKILFFNKQEFAATNLQIISNELDNLPKSYDKYITNIAGTFKYRYIAGTKRLSMHSFGIAIDINTKFANYWKWGKKPTFKNQIPKKIIAIFEEHGFIWGGRWYHYDTMHFEYRPEFSKSLNFEF
jgi:hypothetical protein